MAKKTPSIVDYKSIMEAGVDPKTGLPLKLAAACQCELKDNIKRILRIQDEQDAVNRFIWDGLPKELNGNLIERILFYRGAGMFFYIPTDDKFYFLPYTLNGNIDVYGRFTGTTPLAFGGGALENDKKQLPWIPGLIRQPVYEESDEVDEEYSLATECVLLMDYSKQQSQTILSRQSLNDPIIELESDMLPFLRTALLNSTGVDGMRVSGEQESWSVESASRAVNDAALNGRKWVAITGDMNLQTLTGGIQGKAEEFLLAMQAVDNFRLSTYGLENGGLFMKKAHTLNKEQERNDHNVSLRLKDSLDRRQEACEFLKNRFPTKFKDISVRVNPDALDDQEDEDLTQDVEQKDTSDKEPAKEEM